LRPISLRLFLLLGALGAAVLAWGYAEATRDPLLRETEVALDGMPEGAQPVRLLLISDLHVAGPDMPPERLARIVARINAIAPDIIAVAGDLVSDKAVATRRYSMTEAVAPLTALRAPLGVYVALGNHDHWRDGPAARAALAEAGIRELRNDAVRAGPIALGGLDDHYTRHADLEAATAAMRAAGGAMVLVSHSPDPFPELPADVGLMLAGHTHCGQIAPWPVGPIATASRHGRRYACGRIEEAGRTLIVTAGLGTSMLPLRIGAPPDMWLVTLRPAGARSPQ
jgi:uncharacterized protein